MISALRKIENRGELHYATSAVMEMCIDNPREGFHNIFDTHPSVDARIQALIKYAGGHDPGPLAIEPPLPQADPVVNEPPPGGPWASGETEQPPPQQGPWGPRRS
jgi:heat shock protein HtpX